MRSSKELVAEVRKEGRLCHLWKAAFPCLTQGPRKFSSCHYHWEPSAAGSNNHGLNECVLWPFWEVGLTFIFWISLNSRSSLDKSKLVALQTEKDPSLMGVLGQSRVPGPSWSLFWPEGPQAARIRKPGASVVVRADSGNTWVSRCPYQPAFLVGAADGSDGYGVPTKVLERRQIWSPANPFPSSSCLALGFWSQRDSQNPVARSQPLYQDE